MLSKCKYANSEKGKESKRSLRKDNYEIVPGLTFLQSLCLGGLSLTDFSFPSSERLKEDRSVCLNLCV